MCLAEKFWRANSNFFPTSLPCAPLRHTAKRVFDFCHTANARVCRVPKFHRVFPLLAHVKKVSMLCA